MSLISKGWKSRWLEPREFGELTHGRSNSASPGQGGEQIMAVDSFLAPVPHRRLRRQIHIQRLSANTR